jgi:hypothetical protein
MAAHLKQIEWTNPSVNAIVNRKTLPLLFGIILSPCLAMAQTAVNPFEKLPDWSGLWSMIGGTVFDAATQTGKGGVVTPGVREHPPYAPVFETIYQGHLALRDADRYPDVICRTPTNLWSGLTFFISSPKTAPIL